MSKHNIIILDYVWIDGYNKLRSKKRTLVENDGLCIDSVEKIPIWNFDGSSTGQAEGSCSEIILKPCALFDDPLQNGKYISDNIIYKIVLCTTYKDGYPTATNHRDNAFSIFQKKMDEEPWFGLEQEYFLIDKDTGYPLGFCNDGSTRKQGDYYCGLGSENSFGRQIVEEHLSLCIKAGVKIAGINAEVAPGQWEFQIGICEGIEAGDHLWIARYLLLRVAEMHNVCVSFEPKPIKGNWNGSGCHTNYSTKIMRSSTCEHNESMLAIYNAIECLKNKHNEHMKIYGENNDKRMTGDHETSSYDVFSFVNKGGNRGASIRIGTETINDGYGYFEDRRPASNCDPYLVTSAIFKTTVLDQIENIVSSNDLEINCSSNV